MRGRTHYQIEIYVNGGQIDQTPVRVYRGFSGDKAHAEREAARILKDHDAEHTHTARVVVSTTDSHGRRC